MELKKKGLITEFETNPTSGKFSVKRGGYWKRIEDDSELLEIARGDKEFFERLRNFTATFCLSWV